MKAAFINQNGDLDVIEFGEVADPEPAENEVVVRLQAAALNHLDIWVRKGRPGVELSIPHVLGSDGMGTISAVGKNVTTVRVGDSVVINPGLSCDACEYCLRGDQSECLFFGIVGMSRPGTFAEYVAVPAVNVQPAPAHLNPAEAASLPLAHITAWHMLMSRGNLRAGETVLIHGIGGGVALAGLQLAKMAGAEVIVTSSSQDKLDRALQLGADHVINYRTNPNVAAAVKDLTGGRGVDLIQDTTGAATWPINFSSIRRGGRIVHCGVTTGKTVEVDISALYWNHVTVMGSTMGSHEDFRKLLRTVSSTKLKPVVDCVFPLADAKSAVGKMEVGEQFGKIVLDVVGTWRESYTVPA
ncbi:MAG: zinc-binding dehydrogenase [Candidatus Hydrogenedentes bacterium]|nr:zinc-binding dehydrogenase [Candidatus Hydrogenedentota bacterium]